MRKQGVAKPVNGKQCDKCDYYNPKKKTLHTENMC